MPQFSWIQYSFNAPGQPLPREAWLALRSTSVSDHEGIIERMKAERWDQFWKDHIWAKWCAGIFVVGVICFIAGEDRSALRAFGALGNTITVIAFIQLFISAASHGSAQHKQSQYFRGEFARAATSETYEAYLHRR